MLPAFRTGRTRVRIVDSRNVDQFLPKGLLPKHFGEMKPETQKEILKVALLFKFGGLLFDASSVPISKDGLMQIWTTLQSSQAEALGTYSMQHGCHWHLGMWFLAAKPGSSFIKHWWNLLLQEIGAARDGKATHPELLYMANTASPMHQEGPIQQPQELPSGSAWLLQYQTEKDLMDELGTPGGDTLGSPFLRARSRCATDLWASNTSMKSFRRKHQAALVSDPAGYLMEWNQELSKEAEGCYLDLSFGFEDWQGERCQKQWGFSQADRSVIGDHKPLTVPHPQKVPAFQVIGKLTMKQLVPDGIPRRWME
eukprot:Skav221745  [mRNA]  locus=scaffold2555:50656:53905:+ [translate_table: standard]